MYGKFGLQPLGFLPDDQIAAFAEQILKVYGKPEPSVLDKEIKRMAHVLGIPEKEVI